MKAARMLTIVAVAVLVMMWTGQFARAVAMETAFTYQGHLYDANYVANGLYDFQFKLYDSNDPCAGSRVGSSVNRADVDVIDGYFTVALDFNDANGFNGEARWLEIGVRPGEMNDPNGYTPLSPLQEVTPAPYALYAKTAVSDNDWQISGSDMYSMPSGNVGVGTSSPTQKLTVDNGDIYLKTLNGRYLFRPNPGGGSGDLAWLKYYQRSGDDTTLEIATQNDGGDHIALLPSGNVGIGTANPDDFLEIEGSLGGKGLHLDSSSGAGINLDRAATSNHCKLVLETDGTEQWAIGNKGENNENLGFYPYGGSTANVVFLQNGNVGIGTSAPGAELEVNGQVKVTGGSPGSGKVLTSDASGLASWQSPSAGGDSDWTIDGNDMYSGVSGRVGVGPTSPAAYLDVRPSAGTAGDEVLQAFSPADAAYISTDVAVIQGGPATYTGTVLKVQARAADDSGYGLLHIQNGLGSTPSSKLYVRGDGNVGIGTSSPTQRLTVDNGDIYLKTLNGRYLFRGNPGGGSGDLAWLKYYQRSGDDTTLEIVTANDSGDHIALMPSGNVGVGTANPGSKLEVNGIVHSTSGGIKFPDGTLQTTAGDVGDITAVNSGTGLTGGDTSGDVTLNVNFAGSGSAGTVSRSDHNHNATYSLIGHTHSGSDITSGTLSTSRFSAHSDLSAEGYLGDASGDVAQNNGTLQTDLNADMLDGAHGTKYLYDMGGSGKGFHSGVVSCTGGSASVTWSPGFTSNPVVTATAETAGVIASVSSIGQNSCMVNLRNHDGTTYTTTTNVHWIAMGPR